MQLNRRNIKDCLRQYVSETRIELHPWAFEKGCIFFAKLSNAFLRNSKDTKSILMASVLRFILMEFTSWGGVSPDFCKSSKASFIFVEIKKFSNKKYF